MEVTIAKDPICGLDTTKCATSEARCKGSKLQMGLAIDVLLT